MSKTRKRNKKDPLEESRKRIKQAWHNISKFSLFTHLEKRVYSEEWMNPESEAGWAFVTKDGRIFTNPEMPGSVANWEFILAHCLLHLAFNHFVYRKDFLAWNIACDCVINQFLHDLKFGTSPGGLIFPVPGQPKNEDRLYKKFQLEGIPDELIGMTTAGRMVTDIKNSYPRKTYSWYAGKPDWQQLFSMGLSEALRESIRKVSEIYGHRQQGSGKITPAELCREWFISNFPLLGSLAAHFRIIEDPKICWREEVSIGAVNPNLQEIYISPAAGLNEEELRFVIAHELLHVGLQHGARRQGRDPFLWNVACDYLINQWLKEMHIGYMPPHGCLLDPKLVNLSAESIYDKIIFDIRRAKKLATFRGQGVPDLLDREGPRKVEGITLDEFYRRCLMHGLWLHQEQGRGLLPAGLVEEIRALDQPPISWDVKLARWFDEHFRPIERKRTYAIPSRRQAATPDIPRPRYVFPEELKFTHTFGVVLDSSASMYRELLAKALGAIAGYAVSRDVMFVRLIYCDALPYDEGFVPVLEIAGSLKVKGRGGTVLQPAIDLLLKAEDFPKDAPILVLTDGECDKLNIARDHAFVLPQGAHLPFAPVGPVFYVS